MKKQLLLPATFLLAFLLLLNSSFTPTEKAPAGEYYQLTIYHCKTAEQIAVTSAYLKSTYLPALHKYWRIYQC
jgi:hypothetical protein